MGARIGVDVGGTFTDVCLFDEVSKSLHISKVHSVPAAPEKAIIAGIGRALSESQTKPEDVAFVVHGTTIATNAIIEYKGARVGVLVTDGFRDILQIIRQDRPK